MTFYHQLDWSLLRRQKLWLLAQKQDEGGLAAGLVALIDEIQDDAVDKHGIDTWDVFGLYEGADANWEPSDIRNGSGHEETPFSGSRSWCGICGWTDNGFADPKYHPEAYYDPEEVMQQEHEALIEDQIARFGR